MKDEKDKTWRLRLHEIIYESNTTAGKAFDVSLLILIIASIIIVMLDSIERWHNLYGPLFSQLEWLFTFVFTLEYILRLISIEKPWKYVFSFLGIIDMLAIIPSYLSIMYSGAQSLLVFRGLRLLRIFRIFKLTHFLSEMRFLGGAIRGSLTKISIFMMVVLTLVIILGSLMYLIEEGQNGFSSIPDSIYWAIVTITTVGYGDISPATPFGKFVASIIMLMGYGIIAVPTGILTNEIALEARKKEQKNEVCPGCGKEGHDIDAKHCKNCGALL
ncbi:MAG TPA: ion transporter [Segetibacter sp.]|nr:ion transporter [Segetibacter sp.]